MAKDDEKPGDPFHSGHTVMLGAELPDATPAAPEQPAGPAGGHYSPTSWGAKTMALPIEAFDGLDGLPATGGGGPTGQAAPAGAQSGKTMAMPMEPGPSPGSPPGGAPPGPAPGGYGEPPAMPDPYGGGGGGPGGPPGGADPGGGIPYLETQAISADDYMAQQSAPSPMPGPPGPMEDEPVKTTLLDPSKLDMSAYGGGPPAPSPPPYSPPPPQPMAPPPSAPPDAFDSSGMAQGQKTVILRPEAAEQALAQMEGAKAQTLPPALKGNLIIFVPDTDPIQFELMPGITTVGRGMENHLVLGDPYASRKHMVITNKDGQYFFEDTGSDNGTMVNNQRCSTKSLATGDVVEIGSVLMRFVMGDVTPQHFARPAATAPSSRGGKVAKRKKKKKKKNTTQLILLIFLVVATLGMVGVMVMLYLQRQGG